MKTTHDFTALVEREGDGYAALCPEFDVASQGDTLENALANLREAVQLYLETADPAEIDLPAEPPFLTTLDVAVA